MAIERIAYCIGYIGMTLHYHYVYLISPNFKPSTSTSSIVKEKFKPIIPKNVMLSSRRKFHKPHIKRKNSTNYEGLDKNKK